MIRRGAVVVVAALAAACVDVSDNSDSVLSLQFDPLPSPSVVVGDSLRDTTGAISVPVVRAFNHRGEEIASAPIRFFAPDAGISVDSISGVVTGDSLRSTPARIIATVGSLQALRNIETTLRPDLVSVVDGRDTVTYSRTDTTSRISAQLTVKVTHGTAPDDTAVRAYIVSFGVVSASDPRLAALVSGSALSSIDTTDAGGVAGRAVRISPLYLFSEVDSVIVNATVRYRGTPISGSPVRLVVVARPQTP
ncbi:MAG TPA: hypothetical protein VFS56_02965 [Gemmatimonadaceae bacterium]|nr:hypothetical protein [Gemmatimonadaceae bacterium]